jgi:hypothetical protein
LWGHQKLLFPMVRAYFQCPGPLIVFQVDPLVSVGSQFPLCMSKNYRSIEQLGMHRAPHEALEVYSLNCHRIGQEPFIREEK